MNLIKDFKENNYRLTGKFVVEFERDVFELTPSVQNFYSITAYFDENIVRANIYLHKLLQHTNYVLTRVVKIPGLEPEGGGTSVSPASPTSSCDGSEKFYKH